LKAATISSVSLSIKGMTYLQKRFRHIVQWVLLEKAIRYGSAGLRDGNTSAVVSNHNTRLTIAPLTAYRSRYNDAVSFSSGLRHSLRHRRDHDGGLRSHIRIIPDCPEIQPALRGFRGSS
jgi:hypothetical protein